MNAISVRIFEGEVIPAVTKLSRRAEGYAGEGIPGRGPGAAPGISARNSRAKAWDLWLNCLSEREIAEALGIVHETVSNWVAKNRTNPEFSQPQLGS